jgi:HEAT repeat protein
VDLKVLLDVPPWEWPDDAAGRFLHALRDKNVNAADRLVAAELAGDLVAMNDSLAAALLTIAGDAEENEELRARAAIGLGAVLEECDINDFDDPLGYDEPPIAELTFHRIRTTLEKLYEDRGIAKLVRRRILEASVRSPQDWHRDAIRAAYASGDREWVLTAVFAMQWVRGFDDQIMEALGNRDVEIQAEAVMAAGNWSLDAAWDHVAALVEGPETPKSLRLAAIEAIGSIRPQEAMEILIDLSSSQDQVIAEAAEEALLMAEGAESFADGDDEDEDAPF